MPAILTTRGLGHRGSLVATRGLGRTGLGGFGTGIPGGAFGPGERKRRGPKLGLMPPSKLKPAFKAKELDIEIEVDVAPFELLETSAQIRDEIQRFAEARESLESQMLIQFLEFVSEMIEGEIDRRRAEIELAEARLFLMMVDELIAKLIVLRRRKEEEEIIVAAYTMGLLH